MNNEYLWNKTGSDQEIERLEKTLAAFRYCETVPPVSPIGDKAPVIAAGDPHARFAWRGFAFAASVAVVSIASVAWLPSTAENKEFTNARDVVFVSGPESPLADVSIEPASQDIQISEPPARRSRNGHGKINSTTASAIRGPRTKDAAPKDSVAALSDEERYAYRQLMLALSITGSKLKIVQNTIDGTQDIDDDSSKNQR
ncbi:MAG: hypothetical protein ABI646_04195 [Acidobacteriota bacterium]